MKKLQAKKSELLGAVVACWMLATVALVMAEGATTQDGVEIDILPATAPATTPAFVPTTIPSTSPATTAPVKSAIAPTTRVSRLGALPADYEILTTRSIFMKGRVPIPAGGGSNPTTPTTQTGPVRAEGKIVFIGVIDTDGAATAVFEDTAAGKILQCVRGGTIATGRVTEITLDAVTYESAGKTTRVLVGQTLDAGEAPGVASRATLSSGSSSSPTTSSSGGADSDVLERMRAKRRQELGQ